MKAIRQIAFKGDLHLWFIKVECTFQVVPVKISSFGSALGDDLVLEKHLYLINQKQWVKDIPDY